MAAYQLSHPSSGPGARGRNGDPCSGNRSAFTGLGVAIVWVALLLLALGRFSMTGAWDARAPAEPAPDTAEEPADSGAATR